VKKLLIVLAICLLLCGCQPSTQIGPSQPDDEKSTEAATTPTEDSPGAMDSTETAAGAHESTPEKIAARVNDKQISAAQMEGFTECFVPVMTLLISQESASDNSYYERLTEYQNNKIKASIEGSTREKLLKSFIISVLIQQEVDKVEPDDYEIYIKQMDPSMEEYLAQLKTPTVENEQYYNHIIENAKKSGMKLDEYLEKVAKPVCETVLAKEFLFYYFADNIYTVKQPETPQTDGVSKEQFEYFVNADKAYEEYLEGLYTHANIEWIK